MLLWDEALYTGRLLPCALLDRAFSPALLHAGTSTHYGYGWGVADYAGHKLLEHEGGTLGFHSYALRIPDRHVFVVVLMNRLTAEPSLARLSLRMAALTLGKPYTPPTPIRLDPEQVAALVGVYHFHKQYELTLTNEGNRLFTLPTGWVRMEVYASSPTELFPPRSHTRYKVIRAVTGQVTALEWHDRQGPVRTYLKTAKPLPKLRRTVLVESKVFESYVGEYRIGPYVVEIFHEDGALRAQVTGEMSRTLIPESDTTFYFEDADISVEFEKDPTGCVRGLLVHADGQTYPCKRTRQLSDLELLSAEIPS